MTTTKSARIFGSKENTLLGLQFLSDFGDQITNALLAACLLDLTRSAGKVGLVYFITTAGYIIFTLAGGFIGDKISKKSLLFFSDAGRGLVVLLMIFAFEQKSILLIYLTSFLLSMLGSFNRPVKLSIWAETIPSNKLERYNSLSELSIQASSIVGPLIASFFIMKEWTNLGFAIDAISFFICAIVFVQLVFEQKRPDHLYKKKSGKDFLKGFTVIIKEKDILKFVSYDAIQMLSFGAFNATFSSGAKRFRLEQIRLFISFIYCGIVYDDRRIVGSYSLRRKNGSNHQTNSLWHLVRHIVMGCDGLQVISTLLDFRRHLRWIVGAYHGGYQD